MARTQLNIKIPEELLEKLKHQARSSGTTVTQHIIDLVKASLNIDSTISPSEQIDIINQRLELVESRLENISIDSNRNAPFTEIEAINLSNYLKLKFNQNIKNKGFVSKKQAWLEYTSNNIFTNQIILLRLKEIFLNDDPDLLTVDELNNLLFEEEDLDQILKSFFDWIGMKNPPSLSSICSRGRE